MKLVVILNVNPNPNVHEKISDNREYTCRELKSILEENFLKFVKEVTFYDNFEYFKINVQKHLNDFVLNFDFGYKSRTRNMNVPAFCENYNIKYFNPDPYVQVLCQDKFMTEKFAENFGVTVPNSLLVFKHSYQKNLLKDLNYPLIIKPNYESESIGITQDSIVETLGDADTIIVKLFKEFDGILVEEYIEGKEVAITIWDNGEEIFFEEVELIFPRLEGIKYQAYTSEIKQKIGIEIKKSCYLSDKDIISLKQLYKNLSPNKLIRIDGRIRNSKFYLIEINANPGLYPKSVVPKTFLINGHDYEAMLKKLFSVHLN
ncbi:TPA: ATP-grasp domain-containing protein [Streptococcus suis]|nr:ATP-grasp domain-containing protein [Streptococcus suis]HEL2694209.1 ATP-grasp domain-containing protein [Streptococcus suis]